MTWLKVLLCVACVLLAGEKRANSVLGQDTDEDTDTPEPLVPSEPEEEPPDLTTSRTSFSAPYSFKEVTNTSRVNTSSSPSELQKGSISNASISSPGQPPKPLHGPSRPLPTQRERTAARQLRSHTTNINTSLLCNNYSLPNWERVPRSLTTQRKFSRVYRLPSWESSLFLFGVRSNNEVRIGLLHADTDEAPVNITLYGNDTESDIQFNLSRSGDVLVSPYKLSLALDNYTWLCIFRKNHTVYVFLAGKPDPFLAYEHPNDTLHALEYTRFQVWSEGMAHWDFVGKKYQNENKNTDLSQKAVTEELEGITEGLAERFGLLTNLVSLLQRPNIVNSLSLQDIQEIKDIGESVVPLRNILFYFGAIDDRNKHWTSTQKY